MTALLEARGLAREYHVARGLFAPSGTVKALDGVSFTLERRPHFGGGRRIRLRKVDARAASHVHRKTDRRRLDHQRSKMSRRPMGRRAGACVRKFKSSFKIPTAR